MPHAESTASRKSTNFASRYSGPRIFLHVCWASSSTNDTNSDARFFSPVASLIHLPRSAAALCRKQRGNEIPPEDQAQNTGDEEAAYTQSSASEPTAGALVFDVPTHSTWCPLHSRLSPPQVRLLSGRHCFLWNSRTLNWQGSYNSSLVTKLVVENLKHRPLRTLLTVLAIGLQVTLVLTIVGLSRGLIEASQARTRGVGADILFARLERQYWHERRSDAGKVCRVYRESSRMSRWRKAWCFTDRRIESITGIDIDRFDKMSGGLDYRQGGPFKSPDDILIDEISHNNEN